MNDRRKDRDGFYWSYIDLQTLLIIAFAALAVYATLVHHRQSAGVRPAGLVIRLTWQKTANDDVDLWVKAPGDRAVGFSHMADNHCNLLRDDLGRSGDTQSRNEEMVFCRGAPAGAWVVDVMLYRTWAKDLPITATVAVLRIDGSGVTTLLKRKVTLRTQPQETTVFRFELTKHQHIVPGSVNDIPKMLFPL